MWSHHGRVQASAEAQWNEVTDYARYAPNRLVDAQPALDRATTLVTPSAPNPTIAGGPLAPDGD